MHHLQRSTPNHAMQPRQNANTVTWVMQKLPHNSRREKNSKRIDEENKQLCSTRTSHVPALIGLSAEPSDFLLEGLGFGAEFADIDDDGPDVLVEIRRGLVAASLDMPERIAAR